MYIYYRPRDGQVMGVYSDAPFSTVFSGLGYLVATVPRNIKVTRDHSVTVVDGAVTAFRVSINDEQPKESVESLKQRALDLLHAEQILKRALDPACPQVIKDYAATLP